MMNPIELWLTIVAGVAIAGVVGFFSFVISSSVRQGKFETRLDTAERDLDNLGEMVRNQKQNRRAS